MSCRALSINAWLVTNPSPTLTPSTSTSKPSALTKRKSWAAASAVKSLCGSIRWRGIWNTSTLEQRKLSGTAVMFAERRSRDRSIFKDTGKFISRPKSSTAQFVRKAIVAKIIWRRIWSGRAVSQTTATRKPTTFVSTVDARSQTPGTTLSIWELTL